MFSAELAFRTAKFDETSLRVAKHVIHLDASHGAGSVIGHGAQSLFAALGTARPDLHVEHVRLWEESTRSRMEYNLEHVRSKMAMLAGNSDIEDVRRFAGIEELAARVASAQGLVISAPMWNYGAPYVLKQYFDCILHPGLTFRETSSGPTGLLGGGRPLVIITSSGGSAGKDHLTPWLLDVAAMMGFDDPVVVSAPNVAQGDRQVILDGIAHDSSVAAQHFCEPLGGRGRQCSGSIGNAAAATGESPLVASAPMDEDPQEDWGKEALMRWLRAQGGLTQNGLESVEEACDDSELFCQASEEDWRNEEMGLEDADVARLLELQRLFTQALRRGRLPLAAAGARTG